MKRLALAAVLFVALGVLFTILAHAENLTKAQPRKKIKVPAVRIQYMNDRMTDFLTIGRANQNPGVITGDSLTFAAVLSSVTALDNSRYSWAGAASGVGRQISAAFGTPGNPAITVSVFDKNSKRSKVATAITRARFVGPETEPDICPSSDPATFLNCTQAATDAALAESWATSGDMGEALGFGHVACTADDGKCNAAKHAYWNLLMVRDTGPAFAARLATAHERYSEGFLFVGGTSGLNAGSAHNSVVMDLDNNSAGRTIAGGISFSSSYPFGDDAGKTAIASAANSGSLTKLDPLPNPSQGPLKSSSLLTPSNQ